eukprot:Selendium_serpulae@DN6012_c0_g1_i2.p1
MWLIGVTITIVGSFLGALGDILVRLSFTREDKKDEALRRPLIKRPLWLSGMFCSVVLDGVMTIVALNFTSAAIVTPFAGLHIFWKIAFSVTCYSMECSNFATFMDGVQDLFRYQPRAFMLNYWLSDASTTRMY